MKKQPTEPYARFDAFHAGGRGWELSRPLGVIEAWRATEVEPALRALESVVAGGVCAGGFVTYEAASAIDPTLTTCPARPDLPLLWFGLFGERREVKPPMPSTASLSAVDSPWTASLTSEDYARRVGRIRQWIAAGDTYQVNLTFQLQGTAPKGGSDFDLYATLGQAQRAAHCALLRLPSFSVLSISPELFFRWCGGELELRPMKGTCRRGRWSAEDRRLAEALRRSEKERAENLMIVDLLRNDAGRVAEFGSVQVTHLFEVESYPTVHQLTTTIRARTRPDVTLYDLFRALFPSGSVTGAPKVRTMEIIAGLEGVPRGVYTGAVGFVTPEEVVFNVPIRTLLMFDDGRLEMGVGSGITYDSTPGSEYAECLQKAAFTTHRIPSFSLLETLLHDPESGYHLLEQHLDRLAASAAYFGYPFDRAEALAALTAATEGQPEPRRIRLLLSSEGSLLVESSPFAAQPEPLRARLASEPVRSDDVFLFHKTTLREPYERRLSERPGFDEVLMVNERGELTEFANGNLVVRLQGEHWTPPIRCGLLPGVMRRALLEEGSVRERILRPEELEHADAIYRVNSVRGWNRVEVALDAPVGAGSPAPSQSMR